MAINQTAQPLSGPAAPPQKARTSFGILGAISLSHLLNDMIQSLILAIYPLLQAEFSLTFVQIGMITLTFQLTSSLFQPVIGYITDKTLNAVVAAGGHVLHPLRFDSPRAGR
ncbi:Fosmidomycin resistance protein [Klebsiella pneumoniae ISC21]|nr:Fosmidomycin resistance protein [Klebsiella pneumoniae ISC21]